MIPISEPLFISGEKEHLARCIEQGWISSEGPFVKEFEERFSAYVGRQHGVAVSSGTAALEIALEAMDLKPGDEVIMPTFTIMSCALAVVAQGGVPVFVDAEPDTWNSDMTKIEAGINEKTRALMAVHTYGHPCDMDVLVHLAKKYNLLLIEDAAEAHGAEYKRKKCGGFGDISCFSFYANKIVNTGEGGMVLTNNPQYAERARTLRNLAFQKGNRFHHEELARNYRMTNLQAAVGVAQMKNIERLVQIKRENARKYTERLCYVKGLQLPHEKEWAKNVYWTYGIVLDEATGFTAERFAAALAEKGIATRPFFYPLHLQPVWHKKGITINTADAYPVAERIATQGLYLPSGLGLKEKQIEEVCAAVKIVLNQ